MKSFSRRDMVKASLAVPALSYLENPKALFADSSLQTFKENGGETLSSNSGVFVPAKGKSFLKFSFDFPEPSFAWQGYQFSFRINTYENVFAMEPSDIRIMQSADQCELSCVGFSWAGGQERIEGHLVARLQKSSQTITITAEGSIPHQSLKSITTIVRWFPRGELSVASDEFFDPKDDEILHSWPDLMGGMPSPIMVTRRDNHYCSVSLAADQKAVRNARFYLRPGDQGYRVELVYEREAWNTSDTVRTAVWNIREGNSHESVAAPHYAHVEHAFGIQPWETRPDVPNWMRGISLVAALHGAHWTGYIFNDYARQLEILKWLAQQISANKVLVFLPAWDGRYYWNYPLYKTDPRMGGDAGFHRLIKEGQALGFHLVPMFGSNVANSDIPSFDSIRKAVTIKPDGDTWYESYVDWDNDRRTEGNYGFMNLGVAEWRDHLAMRIMSVIEQFGVDGYFLDIVGTSENNKQGDMFLGTARLVETVRQRFPNKLCVGEMHYDALLGSIGVYQADRTKAYPAAVYKYARMFEHLSWPAPGRGSTGVHEFGFSPRFALPRVTQNVIPTLTIVDDTFTRHQEEMKQIIEIATRWIGYST